MDLLDYWKYTIVPNKTYFLVIILTPTKFHCHDKNWKPLGYIGDKFLAMRNLQFYPDLSKRAFRKSLLGGIIFSVYFSFYLLYIFADTFFPFSRQIISNLIEIAWVLYVLPTEKLLSFSWFLIESAVIVHVSWIFWILFMYRLNCKDIILSKKF